jgi:hypothetical protein
LKRWGLVIALLLSLGANVGILATFAFLRTRPPLRQQQPAPVEANRQIQRLANRLGLEGETRRRFVLRQRQFFEETAGLRREIGDVNRELRREITRAAPDPQRIDRLVAESAETFAALEKAMVDHVSDSRALLDPGQERKFLDFIKRLRGGPFAARWRIPPNQGGAPRNP